MGPALYSRRECLVHPRGDHQLVDPAELGEARVHHRLGVFQRIRAAGYGSHLRAGGAHLFGDFFQLVWIYGDNFGNVQGNSYVTFQSGLFAQVVSWSNTQVRVVVPSGAVSGNAHLGLELGFSGQVFLRGGMDSGWDAGDVTAGAGFRISPLTIDYAYAGDSLDIDEVTHRLSLSVRF